MTNQFFSRIKHFLFLQVFWILVSNVMIVCLLASDYSLNPKTKGSDQYFPIQYFNKWGFINNNGKIQVQPIYESAGCFYHGMARVSVLIKGNYKSGFIDKNEHFVIPPIYDQAGDFKGELAPVRIGRKWGYVNTAGDMVITPTYQGAGEFHGKLALVQRWSKIYVPFLKKELSNIDAPVQVFDLLRDPFTFFILGNPPYLGLDNQFSFIDKEDHLAFQFQDFEFVDNFSNGYAVYKKGKKWGYINQQGGRLADRLFDLAVPFSEGLAPVKIDGLWGFIDTSGNVVIKPQFGGARPFSGGIAIVFPQGQSFLESKAIDKKGNYLFSTIYNDLSDFSEGLAIVKDGRHSFFIDQEGKKVHITDLIIEGSWGFSDGLAIVGKQGKRVYIDKKGKVIAPYEK
jgi:hypothetical protein